MKKLLQLLFILFLGVISCACVNIFAVHELNEKANNYLKDGDIKSAVSRLEASVDLDGSIYESRYNLASAYMSLGECEKAVNQAELAIKLSNKQPASYYTHAVALQCSADNLFKKKNEHGVLEEVKLQGFELQNANKRFVELMNQANESYNKYVELAPHAEDSQDVIFLIKSNQDRITALESQTSSVAY